jgi:hypothetical protein
MVMASRPDFRPHACGDVFHGFPSFAAVGLPTSDQSYYNHLEMDHEESSWLIKNVMSNAKLHRRASPPSVEVKNERMTRLTKLFPLRS